MRRAALAALALAVVGAAPQSCAHRPDSRGAAAVARDSAAVVALLGGTLNAACPLPGIATGGQPDSVHFAALAGAGFRTVIDTRLPGEPRGYDERAVAGAAGLEYVALPVSGTTLSDSTFDAFRALMQDARRTPALVHCSSGNRVGALMVPWLVLDRGWPLERALASAEAGGLRAGAVREKALEYLKHRATSE